MSTIRVFDNDLDITNRVGIDLVGTSTDFSAELTGVGTYDVKYLLKSVPNKDKSIDLTGISITYAGITQIYYITWHKEKQGKSGSSTAFAGKWSAGKRYYLREGLRTVVFLQGATGNKTYYWTRQSDHNVEIPAGQSPDQSDYWEEFAGQFESVATAFLFSEDAYITDLTSAKLIIGDEFERGTNNTSLRGWIIDKDVIRSRATAPMLAEDGKTEVTYLSEYIQGAEKPFNTSAGLRQPATVLYSDGGIITNKAKLGAWTLTSDAIFTSVPFGTNNGIRRVIGLNKSEVTKLTLGSLSSVNSTPDYLEKGEKYERDAVKGTKATRYSFFVQSPTYLPRESDGKECMLIDVSMSYLDKDNFGLSAALYDDQKNVEVEEYFHLGCKTTTKYKGGKLTTDKLVGGRIAGWTFDSNHIYNGYGEDGINHQQVSLYSSAQFSGIEVFGGDEVVTDDTTFRGRYKSIEDQKPEYLMRLGYDTTRDGVAGKVVGSAVFEVTRFEKTKTGGGR